MQQKGSRHPLVAGGAPSEAGPISNRCQGESWRESERKGADGMGWWSPGRTEATAGVEGGLGEGGEGELHIEDCQTKAMRLEAEEDFNIGPQILASTASVSTFKMSNVI